MPDHERKVYIPSRSFHDFTPAERFGRLVFLTEGTVKRLNVNQLYRVCAERMADANGDDYLLVSSLSIINAVASSILAYRFGRVNYLMFNGMDYSQRNIQLSTLDVHRSVGNSDSQLGNENGSEAHSENPSSIKHSH